MKHITVHRKGDEKPRPVPSLENPDLYQCPFCSPELYRPAGYSQMATHLASHWLKAVNHRDYIIYSCGLGCAGKAKHFHCCHCSKTYINKNGILKHLDIHCQDASSLPLAASTSAPATSGPSAASTSAPATSGPSAASTSAPATSGSSAASTSAPSTSGSSAASTSVPATSAPSAASTSAPSTSGSSAASTSAPATSAPSEVPSHTLEAHIQPQSQHSEQNVLNRSNPRVVTTKLVSVQCPHCNHMLLLHSQHVLYVL